MLFNTARTGYNVLAASDAIGMGLNLNIKYAKLPVLAQKASSSSLERNACILALSGLFMYCRT